MQRLCAPKFLLAMAFAMAAALLPQAASAQSTWSDYAFISSTIGVSANRVCTGEATRGDLGCAANAPVVSTSTGALGIGTNGADPSSTFHVYFPFASTGVRFGDTGHYLMFNGNTMSSAGGPLYLNYNNSQGTYINNGTGGNISLGGFTTKVNVGASTNTPSTTLDVSGSLKIANGGEACDSNRSGAIRYTSSGDFQVCFGSGGWSTFANASISGTISQPDRITSGTTQLIANNNGNFEFQTSGVATGYYTPQGILSSVGISTSTNQASFTTLYASKDVTTLGRYIVNNGAVMESYGGNGMIRPYNNGTASMIIGAGPTSPTITVTSQSFVGVGTTDPSRAFHVQAGSGIVAAAFTNTAANGALVDIVANNAGADGSGLRLLKGATSSSGGYQLGLHSSSGNFFISPNANTTNSSYASASFVLTSASNVGIGTTTPSATLHVMSASPSAIFTQNIGIGEPIFMVNRINSTQNNSFGMAITNATGKNANGSLLMGPMGSSATTADIVFSGSPFITSNGGQFTIKGATGNVGIGTAAPSTTLHVSGTIRIADGGEACDANRAGAIRYTSASTFQVCYGSGGWATLGTTSATEVYALNDLTDVSTSTAAGNMFLGSISGANNGVTNTTSIGIGALNNNTTGFANTAIGFQTLNLNTTGGWNTALGRNALTNNTVGIQNTAIGVSALSNITGASDGNTAIGAFAMRNATSTYGNTVLGGNAGYYQSTAYRNTIIGSGAMQNNETGSYNVILGANSGAGSASATTVSGSVFVGDYSGRNATNSDRNIFLGALSGQNMTSGDDNILLGYNNSAPLPTSNFALNIGNSIYGDMTSAKSAVGGSANIGINFVTPTNALEVSGTVSATRYVGDGSGLTGVIAAGSDRITSGTTNVVANANTGYVSFTSSGVTTGYYSPAGILGAVGISTTSNQASFTTTYAGRGMFGTTSNNSNTLSVSNSLRLMNGNGSGYVDLSVKSNNDLTVEYQAASNLLFGQYSGTGSSIIRGNGGFSTNTSNNSYFTGGGGVGIGISRTDVWAIPALSATLHVSGTVRIGTSPSYIDFLPTTGGIPDVQVSASGAIYIGPYSSSQTLMIGSTGFIRNNSAASTIFSGTGRFGIGMATINSAPSTTLHVSGSIRIADSGDACDADRAGAMRYTSSSTFDFCDGATGWKSFANMVSSVASGDRITSGTTGVTANTTGYVSLTTGGVETGYLDTAGRLVVPGISITTANGISTTRLSAGLSLASYGVNSVVNIQGSALGTNAGDFVSLTTMAAQVGNLDKLNFTLIRKTSGTDWTTSAQRIQRQVDSTPMGYMQFGHYNITNGDLLTFGKNNTEYMRLDSTGNLGIGTSAPSRTLHVYSNGNVAAQFTSNGINGNLLDISAESTSSTAGVGLRLYNSNDITNAYAVGIDNSTKNFFIAKGMNFANALAPTAQLVITSNSLVGIGTTTPSYTLHVSGTVRIGTSPSYIDFAPINGNNDFQIVGSGGGIFFGPYSSTNSMRIDNKGNIRVNSINNTVFSGTGKFGIGMLTNGDSPSTTLHVSGTIRIADGGEACDTNRAGAIRYTSSSIFQFCSGSAWQTTSELANAGGGASDRITSGTTNVVANSGSGYVSFTSSGVTTGYYSPGGIFGAVGISTTSNQASFTTVYASGNVGIGTAITSATLHIKNIGAAASSTAIFETATSAGISRTALVLQNVSNVTGTGVGLGFVTDASYRGADIYLNRDNLAGPRHSLRFQVNGSPSIGIDKMTLTDDGNLGIGTTAPSTSLHVVGGIRALGGFGTNNGYTFSGNSGDTDGGLFSDADGVVKIFANGAARMTVRDNGGTQVGIGVTDPSSTLHVSGTLTLSSQAGIGGTITAFGTTNGIDFKSFGGLGIWANSVRTIGMTSASMIVGNIGSSYTPSTTLHVSGTVRIADGGEACDSNRAGAIRYTSASTFDFCDGTTGWKSFSTMVAGAASGDRITSGTTSIVASNNTSLTFNTAGSPRMLVATGGNVGIGNINPQTSLQLGGDFAMPGEGRYIGFNSYYSSANSRYEYQGNGYAAMMRIGQEAAGQGGDIQFYSSSVSNTSGATTAATLNSRMVIKNNGNVGIGTSTPSYTLQVSGTGYYTGNIAVGGALPGAPKITLYGAKTVESNNVFFSNGPDTAYVGQLISNSALYLINQAAAGSLYLGTSNTVRLNINSAGNVGIGMSSGTPSTTLDISGTLRIAGTGAETCDANSIGMNRRNPSTGKVEMCRY